MVIVLKKDISETDKKRIKDFLGEKNFKTNEVPGEEATIIAAVGQLKIDPSDVTILPGVEKVIPISKGYKLASREFNPVNTIVELSSSFGQKIRVGGQRIVAIAGPCAVEERDRMFEIAAEVARSGACMLRGGAYKPRTSPYSFQGLGEEGVKMLKEAGDKYALRFHRYERAPRHVCQRHHRLEPVRYYLKYERYMVVEPTFHSGSEV